MTVMTALRAARFDDLTALRALETACFGRDAWSELSLQAELDGVPATRYVVVAEDAGLVVGYAALLASDRTADVQRIAVRPDRHRQGIGRRLLDALLAEARARDCHEALLEVRADNVPAITLYEQHGFVEIARRPRYFDGGRVDALVLRRSPL